MNHENLEDMTIDIESYPLNQHREPNGIDGSHIPEPSLEELEQELPMVDDGQVHLGDLLSRVVQAIYAELSELAETMPNMSDSARKRTLADWVVKTKKQVVKLYAVAKWSRDADAIQKCMNITAFLMTQNQQFEDTIKALGYAKESLDPARLRNHDLLTSLDVLTTGTYLRLPTCIKKIAIPPPPLTDAEVVKTLLDMEETIRYRLRMTEVIPVEMSRYKIADGRVHFSVPKLFNTSLCLRGGEKDSGWFFVDVEFLINVGGDLTGLQEFPRVPKGIMKRHITDEADARLAFYLPLHSEQPVLPGFPPRPELPTGVVDTPLVRVYNFLQMMSLSYQLEILWYQAERLRSLGWLDYLSVQMAPDRKSLKTSYWIRPPVVTPPGRPRSKIPLMGGTLTISMVEKKAPFQLGSGPYRSPQKRVISRLQQRSKLGTARPSDEVEDMQFVVEWEPAYGALAVVVPPNLCTFSEGELRVDADSVDFESILRKVINRHSQAILTTLQTQLQQSANKVFSSPGVVTMVTEGDAQALRVYLCVEEVIVITIEARTGKLNLRDIGDLAASGRGPRFATYSDKLNENPATLMESLFHLRISTILNLAEQKANYLGLQSFRRRNIKPEEMNKLGPDLCGSLFIQLSHFPNHYLVLVVTIEKFKYALITAKVMQETVYGDTVLEDIAWLDFSRIHSSPLSPSPDSDKSLITGIKRKRSMIETAEDLPSSTNLNGFSLSTQALRELYSYCCARVSFINVERQFKLRGIPFTHVNPSSTTATRPELAYLQSSLAQSVPALCVQSKDILSGAPAAEAAMPNIRVIPLNWWSEEKAKVVTCVKLKYVQQPMGKTASGSSTIRPSKSIIYDTTEAVVSFLSEDVSKCVDEFLEEWATVSKMVVIAREVSQLAKHREWHDIRLLSFDLQNVEFAYAKDYAVSISCQDQLSPTGGNFELKFSRVQPRGIMDIDDSSDNYNPHEDAEPFLKDILRHGHGRLAPSLHRLVMLLRDTLPIVVELAIIRQDGKKRGLHLDIFAKAAGWYRLLYGDLRHGLDFRLMKGSKVVILDASCSILDLHSPDRRPQKTSEVDDLVLQPIPNFREIVTSSIKNGLTSRSLEPGQVAAIDIGVVCNAPGVGPLTKTIHAQVLHQLSR